MTKKSSTKKLYDLRDKAVSTDETRYRTLAEATHEYAKELYNAVYFDNNYWRLDSKEFVDSYEGMESEMKEEDFVLLDDITHSWPYVKNPDF